MCDTFHEITIHKTICSPIQKGKEENRSARQLISLGI
jgi:hypothetical protein